MGLGWVEGELEEAARKSEEKRERASECDDLSSTSSSIRQRERAITFV